MQDTIVIRRLRGGTLFKLIFIGNAAFLVPFTMLMGVLAFFDAGTTISWNEQTLTGLPALVAAPFMGVFMALMFSAFAWVSLYCGLWLYSRFRPLELEYIPLERE